MSKVIDIDTNEILEGRASEELEAASYANGNHTGAVLACLDQGSVDVGDPVWFLVNDDLPYKPDHARIVYVER